MKTAPACIIVFVKEPTPGKVKTRLAKRVGNEFAVELYKRFTADILETLIRAGYPIRICHSPPSAGRALTDWLGPGFDYFPQEGSDLGEKMANAFISSFTAGFSRALLIGTDIPDLPLEFLNQAFSALMDSDAVVGPASDGGYYLIGFRADTFFPAVFRQIPWSTVRVMDETLDKFAAAGRTVHKLPQWQDIDEPEDLSALVNRHKQSGRAWQTVDFLTRSSVMTRPYSAD